MELDKKDRKLLYLLDINARMSLTELSKKLRIPKATVSFRMERLIKKGFVKRWITVIDVSRMGMYYFKIFFKFHRTNAELDKQIERFFVEHPAVPQVLHFQGKYDYLVFFMVRHFEDLTSYMDELKRKFGEYILEKEIHVVTSIHRFNLRFMYPEGISKHTVYRAYPSLKSSLKIDETDLKILTLLEQNARMTCTEIAKQLKISPNTIRRKIKIFEKNKVILGYNLSIDYEKFGLQWYHLAFELRDNKIINKLFSYFNNKNQTVFGSTMLGKYDLSIEILVKNLKELKESLDGMKEKFGDDINQMDVLLITKEPKMVWFPEAPRP